MKRKGSRISAAMTAGLILALSGAALADSIWIKSEVVEVRSGKGAIYPVVAKVKKGTELTVVGREGKWIKVAIPGAAGTSTQGYVYENAISPTKINGSTALMTTGAGDISTGAAAKGLQPSAETYASGRRMDSGPLNRLIAMRDHLDPAEWQRFMAEGRVGAR